MEQNNKDYIPTKKKIGYITEIDGIPVERYRKLKYIEAVLKMKIAEEINVYIAKFKQEAYTKTEEILKPVFDIVTIFKNMESIKNTINDEQIDKICSTFRKVNYETITSTIIDNLVNEFPELANKISDEEFFNIFKQIYTKIEYYKKVVIPLTILTSELKPRSMSGIKGIRKKLNSNKNDPYYTKIHKIYFGNHNIIIH